MKAGIFLLIALMGVGDADAQQGAILHYQGVLTDLADRPLSRATPMSFRLYAEPEGGNPAWEELHGSVDVVDGVFVVPLGSIKPLTPDVLGEQVTYLEVAVDGEPLSPRQPLGAVGRALLADQAKDVIGRDIHPRTVSIDGVGEVIDADGNWVGEAAGPGGGGADGGGGSGIQGPAGPQGAQGAQGAQGVQGVQGPLGPAGPQGPPGASGPAGVQGSVGPQGPAGAQGPAGPRGDAGPQGAQGSDGLAGPVGPAGAQGPPGPAGAPGPGIVIDDDSDLDGYPDWLEVALGTDPDLDADAPEDLDEDGVADVLQGPVGPVGEPGAQGPPGRDGLDGATTPLSDLFDEVSPWAGNELAIPRADVAGVDALIDVDFEGALTALSISVDISHPDTSRLELLLTSPAGTDRTLHATGGDAGVDLVGTYGAGLDPVDALDPLLGEPVVGRWTLHIVDTTLGDPGADRVLNSWSVNLTRRADDAWRLPGNLVVEGSVQAETLCSITPLSVNGDEVPGVIVLTCGAQPPVRLSTFQCGNGAIDPGETCDDGNFDIGDGCDQRCLAECGNGRIDGGEECDDGNLAPNDACTDDCVDARCGDGFIWLGVEVCDDGDDNSDEAPDACRTSCVDPACGDGVTDDGEDCDDANDDDWDGCTSGCEVRDGLTTDTAARTCATILDVDADAVNGTYWIDFDEIGGDVPRQHWCDMDNGGWTYDTEGEPFVMNYTGATQLLTTIPFEAEYFFTLYGASGGPGNNQDGGQGGSAEGSKVFGASTTLYIEIGGEGDAGGVEDQGDPHTRAGGYNGGGRGTRGGSGGGGATDLRTIDGDLDSRILVAGGGGGCGSGSCSDSGGAGGGDNGEAGSAGNSGRGGTQNAGGNSNGAKGVGANNCQDNDEGGGGGGYYGGGVGCVANSAAGGGSGYTGGMDDAVDTTAGVHTGDGYVEYFLR